MTDAGTEAGDDPRGRPTGRLPRDGVRRAADPARAAVWLAAAPACLAAIACSQSVPAPTVTDLSPRQAYADSPFFMRIGVRGLRPGLVADLGGGNLDVDLRSLAVTLSPVGGISGTDATIRLETVDWDGANGLWVEAPANLPAGSYDLLVADPQGGSGILAGAFTSLGLDPAAPMVNVLSLGNGGYVGAAEPVTATVVADDGAGAVAWIHWETSAGNSGDCPDAGASGAPASPHDLPPPVLSCPVEFTAPPLGPDQPTVVPFSLTATAADMAGQVGVKVVQLHLARTPQIDSFSDSLGALGGYQPFMVRGRYFLEGSQVFLGGVPIPGATLGGDRQSDELIVGFTPPHNRAESVSVEVRSPAGKGVAVPVFNYANPPRPRDIQPPVGPTRGGIRVTIRGNDLRKEVVIYVGSTLTDRQPLSKVMMLPAASEDDQTRIVGCLPPGQGAATVWAYDPVTGDGSLTGAFTYDDTANITVPDPLCGP